MYLHPTFAHAGLLPPSSPACDHVVGTSLPAMEGAFLPLPLVFEPLLSLAYPRCGQWQDPGASKESSTHHSPWLR